MSLPHAILGLLSWYPSMSGYDIKQYTDRAIGYFWYAEQSQIYRELGILEKKGLIESQIEAGSHRERKVYSITKEGRIELNKWLRDFPEPPYDISRNPFTLRIFFGNDIPINELEYLLQRYLREARNRLSIFTSAMNEEEEKMRINGLDKRRLCKKLILQRGIDMTKTAISWAEKSLEELQQVKEIES